MTFLLYFFISTAIAFFASPIVIRIYQHFGWVEDPQTHTHVKTTHKFPVPRGGGLVIFTSILVASVLLLPMDKYLFSILMGAFFLTVVGTLDDIFDLSPYIRIVTGLMSASLIVAAGIGVAYVTNPFGAGVIHLDQPQFTFAVNGILHHIWILADIVALLFIMWNMNIVNWSKGLDGQMPGFVAIAATFIALLATRFIDDPTQFQTASLALIVAGAFTGFLFWNVYPQRIMAGYGAGSLAGFFLAVLAILSGAKLATTVMVLAIPTADAVFTIIRRLLAGKSPFWGDRGHLHHKLMDELGWGRNKIALFYWVTTFTMGLLSLYLNTLGKVFSLVIVTGLVFGFLIWAKFQSVSRTRHKIGYNQ